MTATRPLRADAARNRDKLLAAASDLFAERGLDVPMEEIARRAEVSIGTLYNHFPTRGALQDEIIPRRLAEMDAIIDAALAVDDPWQGFVDFVVATIALKAQDHCINEAFGRRFELSETVRAACDRAFAPTDRIIQRAKDSGQLRGDFARTDVIMIGMALTQLLNQTMDLAPQLWRRCLALYLDGLRAEAAHPIDVPPLAIERLEEVLSERAAKRG
ncbi:MAG TPA: helix-turn-helix domain-containing protein [Stackebrandtia sp.]|uniref:TetR/AcrR family transcriptional regulator n=1 Tax=Stackebrandtia sp. TaxID=2023065 RepID=UPI002D2947E3|nr:helix-turn-helix domain-containing protein [Stackebrandtia sp.]HZE39662.1 helix-turn-helix domain-containing protein [Stackebrandtia sp.]